MASCLRGADPKNTPLKINMEPENTPLDEERHLQTTNVWGSMLVFRGVCLNRLGWGDFFCPEGIAVCPSLLTKPSGLAFEESKSLLDFR